MEFEIPFKTPTVNHLYYHFRNKRILTKEARDMIERIQEIVEGKKIEEGRLLRVRVTIFENWYCKNGDVAKKDISNREKFLVDSVFKALGVDDRFIFEEIMTKVQSQEEKAIISIEYL